MQPKLPGGRRARRPRSRTQVLTGLTAILAVVLGLTAWRTAVVQRRTVQGATCYFAADAARVLQARSRLFLESASEPLFAAVGGRAPIPGPSPLPSPAVVADAAATVERCHCAPSLPATLFFRFGAGPDGLDRLVVVAPTVNPSVPRLPPSERQLADSIGLRRAVTRFMPQLPRNGAFAAAVTRPDDSGDTLRGVAVVMPKFDSAGRLRAVYGAVVPPSAFVTSIIGRVFDDAGLLPAILADTSPDHGWMSHPRSYRNRDFANFEVFDLRSPWPRTAGDTVPFKWPGRGPDARWLSLYRSGPMPDTMTGCLGGAIPDPALAGLFVDVGPLAPTYASWIHNSLPLSQWPLLVILLAGMLACGAAAGVTAHRDAELARLRSDFVTSISHELRMPLAQILLAGETLSLGRTRSQSERDDAADSIVREAQRLNGLVDNVLFFSRIEHHNVQTRLVPVNVSEIVTDIVTSVSPLAAGVSATVTSTVPPTLTAMVDPSAFRQILYNLLDNAFKYGPPGQHVAIGAAVSSVTPDHVRIWVEDQGPGIPRGQESAIFEPFVRLNRESNTAVAGSGLGLAVVQHLGHQSGWTHSGSTNRRGAAAGREGAGSSSTWYEPAARCRVGRTVMATGSAPEMGPEHGAMS